MNPLFKLFVGLHIRLYRATGGSIGGGMAGGKVLLLTTTGNKSGQQRTVPIMYFENGGKIYVVASFGGAPQHPAWYKNLAKNPAVTVQVGPRVYQAQAVTVEGAERAPVWAQVTANKRFAEYERKASDRVIPLVRLDEKS